jgi:transketolase
MKNSKKKNIRPEELIVLDKRSKYLRRLVVEALDGGKRGHIGASFSLIEILRVLYDDILNVQPENPEWSERDRCVLSKGHGCLALYALLADKGFFSRSELASFCLPGAMLGGHPEFPKIPGVEFSTGSLGHGLSVGVGMALSARIQKRDSRIFVIMGDGEINEGSVWEAALSAGKHDLENLVVLIDYNKMQSYGTTDCVLPLEPIADKWQSFGFSVTEVNGHNIQNLRDALGELPLATKKPTAVVCHTVKGKGIPFVEGRPEWHHKSNLSEDVIQSLNRALKEK